MVDVSDVIKILQCLAANIPIDDRTHGSSADVDCDGFVTISDVIHILQYIASPDSFILGPQ